MKNYSRALEFLVERLDININILAYQMEINLDYLVKLFKRPTWQPRIDTIMKFSYYMGVNVIEFLVLSNPDFFPSSSRKIQKLGEQSSLILSLESWHIGKTLNYFRRVRNMTQADLSEITNFQISSISLRESRRYDNKPTMKTLEIYCTAFNISLEVFVEKLLSFVSFDQNEKHA